MTGCKGLFSTTERPTWGFFHLPWVSHPLLGVVHFLPVCYMQLQDGGIGLEFLPKVGKAMCSPDIVGSTKNNLKIGKTHSQCV